MTLPAEWPVVEVRVGPYFGTDGRPLEGERVQFEPRAKRIVLLDDTTVVRTITTVTLDEAGEGVAELPVSDDPDISSTGWTWQVREKFRWGQTFDISVLTSDIAAGIDLSEVAPVAPGVPFYPVALSAQVNGYMDLGNVSGDVTVEPVGTQRLVATGPTTIHIDDGGHSDGESFTVLVRGGGDDVSWAPSMGFDHGAPEGDKLSVTFMRVDGFWTDLAGATGGGEEVPPVTDPPTQPGAITVDPTPDGYNLSWVASTVAAGYEVQLDGGTWLDSGANLTHAFTGLTAGQSHSGAVRAYNSVGARSSSRAWGPVSTDSVALHDLIMSSEPEVYVRTTEGSIQDFSRTPGTWIPYNYYNGPRILPQFDGPPLTPGDTASANWVNGSGVQRPADDLMGGATEFTQMVVGGMLPGATGGGGGLGLYYRGSIAITPGQTGTENYQVHQPGGVHTWFTVYDPDGFGDSDYRRYIEGQTSPHSTVQGPGSPPIPTTGYPPALFLNGNENGGGSAVGLGAYTVVWKRVLTHDERVAFATAAATINNPAGGTLT